MKNWEEDDTQDYCSAAADLQDAQAVCDKLGIPLHTANFASEYWDNVFEDFLAEYKAGRTPNPDILCNREIKFKVFLEHAKRLGADAIATGHYVHSTQQDGKWQLLRGLDPNKDQSYFLYTLGQQQLAKSLFPIGTIHKSTVREIAEQQGFVTHDKKDSTGICFIGERPFREFLSQFIPAQPGDMLTPEGQIVGQHQGVMYYTLGQRKGLQIGGLQQSSGEAWYVLGKNVKENQLIVGQGHQHPLLFSQHVIANQLSWVAGHAPVLPLHCTAKTRYRQTDQACIITEITEQGYHITFEQPQRAVTPGQSIVFYADEVCLGGGIIEQGGSGAN
jgi:tRNA-specific 2-thiouridylase